MTEKPTTDCAQCAELRERLWRLTYCLSRMLQVTIEGASAYAREASGLDRKVDADMDLDMIRWQHQFMIDSAVSRLGRVAGRG